MNNPIHVRVRSDARKVYVEARIRLEGGGSINLHMDADRVVFERALRNRAETAGVGFSFGDIIKGAKKLARMSAIRKALKAAKSIVNVPVLGDLIPPTVRAAILATSRATEAAAALRSGDHAERRQAATILQRARTVAPQNPTVARALNLAASLTGESAVRCDPGVTRALASQAERPY